jgi:peptidyl-prolyl cis-trans isomerase C
VVAGVGTLNGPERANAEIFMRFLSQFALAAIGLTVVQPVLAQDAAPAFDANTVMAIVGDTEITLGHMIMLRSSLPEQYQNLPDETLFQGIIDQLVDQELFAAKELADAGSIPFQVELALDNEKRALMASSAISKISEIAITEVEIQAAYQELYANAAPEQEWHAAHILVATEGEAKALVAELDGGADFAALAAEHSSDSTAAAGGDLGWFGLGMMVKPFEEAVIATETGKYSAPVESQFGWHIIKMLETRAKPVPGIEEVRADLIAGLQQKNFDTALQELRAAATITRPETGVPLSAIRDSGLVMGASQ